MQYFKTQCKYHMEEITGTVLYIYRNWSLCRVRTELGGWKGYVSNGLGADMSLPPCLIGGRQVSETWAHSISDPRAEISGILVMVRRSSATSRSTTYWFQFFRCFACQWSRPCMLKFSNRPFPSSPHPPFQSEAKCENQFSFILKLQLIIITKISHLVRLALK